MKSSETEKESYPFINNSTESVKTTEKIIHRHGKSLKIETNFLSQMNPVCMLTNCIVNIRSHVLSFHAFAFQIFFFPSCTV